MDYSRLKYQDYKSDERREKYLLMLEIRAKKAAAAEIKPIREDMRIIPKGK